MTIDEYRSRFQNAASARKYAHRFDRGARQRISRRESSTVAQILSRLPACASVLDVPCGAGRLLPALLEQGRRVLGIDVSPHLIEIARASFGDRVEFRQGDASQIPLPDGAVDCVFSNRLLHHLTQRDERARVLREFNRVTRRWAIVSYFDYHRWKYLRALTRCWRARSESKASAPQPQAFAEELQRAGFQIQQRVPVSRWSSESYFIVQKS